MNEKKLLVLWLTGRCNLKCQYCYAAHSCKKDMDMDTFKKAVKLMEDSPFKIQIAGGEPLLNQPLLEEILEYLRIEKPNISCAIQTNGTLISDSFAKLVKKYRLGVGVSLDGKPEINEKLRGKTKAAVEGIRLLGEYGISINLNAVVTEENALYLADLVDMAVYLGNVRGIGLDLLRISGRAKDETVHRASKEHLTQGLYSLKERVDVINPLLKQPLLIREFQKAIYYLNNQGVCMDYCYASLGHSFVVLPDGECYPCGSLAGEKKYNLGNVHSAVHPIKIHCTKPIQCESCKYRKVCSGGCPSRGLLYGGFDELDCLMKKITFKFAEDAKKEDLRL